MRKWTTTGSSHSVLALFFAIHAGQGTVREQVRFSIFSPTSAACCVQSVQTHSPTPSVSPSVRLISLEKSCVHFSLITAAAAQQRK